MYEPVFNSVLVQIDDEDAKYGSGNDESMLGKSYSKGTVIGAGGINAFKDTFLEAGNAIATAERIGDLEGKQIIWNEGAEAGTTFEFDGKLFGMIYWWDIRACKVGDNA